MEVGKEYNLKEFCTLMGLKKTGTRALLKGLSEQIVQLVITRTEDISRNRKKIRGYCGEKNVTKKEIIAVE